MPDEDEIKMLAAPDVAKVPAKERVLLVVRSPPPVMAKPAEIEVELEKK